MRVFFKLITTALLFFSAEAVNAQPAAKNIKPAKETKKKIGKMLGADISFLPELESRGRKFYDNGVEKDAIQILKENGFNYIRLRVFNNPAADSGYSPKKGFCDLEHTKQMAKRIKAAGLKFLLDFHYSDTWADPGKQFKPAAWKNLDFMQLSQAVHDFTKEVLLALQQQGTLPDMVQVGNEINHGMIWPDANIKNLDTLAAFLKAGITAVTEVDHSIIIMLHIACGGQNEESRYFLDNMLKRDVAFDVIGESYYPRWHGTTGDLKNNLTDLAGRYKQDIIVVEYSEKKQEVNDIAFNLPGNKGKGTCIWEPISWGETIFDKEGKTNELVKVYPAVSKKYKVK
jgi:arabinogalactan endo-1,4-beta-galactosidase